MGSTTNSRHTTPIYHDINNNSTTGTQRNKRPINLITQKDFNINNGASNLDSLYPGIANSKLSPDDMLSLIEANARTLDKPNINTTTNNNNNNNNNDIPSHHLDDTNINKYYSLNVNTIPPYVIARIAAKNNLSDNYNGNSYSEDPFTSTFLDERNKNHVKWGEFLHSIKIPTSSIPVKTEKEKETEAHSNVINDGDGSDYFAEEPMTYGENDVDRVIQAYSPNKITTKPIHKDITNEQLTRNIFKSYDFHSRWQGDTRLKNLFEDNGSIYSRTSDERTSDEKERNNGFDVDLEKGDDQAQAQVSKNRLLSERLKMHRRKRERDIKERAKYWIHENKKDWKPKLLDSIMTNSYFPLFFRLISISLSTIALGLSARLVKATRDIGETQQASTLMALIVQSIGVIYLFYITYDEFTSQPLGLRNPTAKIRLVMLDLLFIIFSSANLSLSFESVFDSRYICTAYNGRDGLVYDARMCRKVKALTAFLFVGLVAWCINFTISVFRIVHTVSSTRDKN